MRRAFNPEMLVLARESRGLLQKEFSDLARLSQGELSKIESGLRIPGPDLIDNFSRVLKYPRQFFFIEDSLKGSTSTCVYYRKRASATLGVIRRALAIVNVRRIQISKLLIAGSAELDANAFTKLDVEANGGPEHIADIIRATWKVPPGPVVNVIRAIEDAGGLVFKCDFGTAKIDALSQWPQGLPPMFFVNVRIPADRMRWTLTHELGHVVMHQIPSEDIEREADRFAAQFLMPSEAIRPYLHGLSLAKLASLKPYWRVAMAALLKRASDLGVITPRQKSYLWFQMGAHGYRTKEPVEIPSEDPTLVKELIDLHRNELGYSEMQISDLLVMDEQEARSEYLRPATQMRIVG